MTIQISTLARAERPPKWAYEGLLVRAARAFLLSPKAASIKLMDVNEFRNVFEPKPKPWPEAKPRSDLAKATEIVEHKISQMARPTQTPRPLDAGIFGTPRDSTVLQQTLPTIVLEKVRPTLQVPTEPSTPLGRVLVVLVNYEGREDRVTGSKIKTLIRDHAWPDDGADEAIGQLLQWEILCRQSNNYLRFYRDRVQVVDRAYVEEVA